MFSIGQSERATQDRVIAKIGDEGCAFFGHKRRNTLMGKPMGNCDFWLTRFLFANSVSA